MPAPFDCVYLAAIAQYKLSAQTGRPAPSLRLLVGHSNLLGTLMQELVDSGVWRGLEAPPLSKPEAQSDSSAKSKFTEGFDECCEGGSLDWDSSDSDGDSTSSSDWSDNEPDDDNHHQPRISETDDGGRELSLLGDHLSQLCFLTSQTGADSSWWPMADLGGRHTDDEPSTQAPVVVSSENAMAEISRSTSSSPSHPSGTLLPPTEESSEVGQTGRPELPWILGSSSSSKPEHSVLVDS